MTTSAALMAAVARGCGHRDPDRQGTRRHRRARRLRETSPHVKNLSLLAYDNALYVASEPTAWPCREPVLIPISSTSAVRASVTPRRLGADAAQRETRHE